MAKMTIKGMDEYAYKLSKLGKKSVEISKKAVRAGADPVADEIRSQLVKNLQGSGYSTGELLDSLGIAPTTIDYKGNANTKIGFEGYDWKSSNPSAKYPYGKPNALKARAMESGTSTQKKKPFIRPALRRAKKKCLEEMGRTIDEESYKIFALKID